MSNPYPKTMHEDVAPGILNSHPPYRLLMGALFLALIATLSPAASANISTRRRRRHGKITRTQKERKKKAVVCNAFLLGFGLRSYWEEDGILVGGHGYRHLLFDFSFSTGSTRTLSFLPFFFFFVTPYVISYF